MEKNNKKDKQYKINKFYEILKESPLDAYIYSANNELGLEHIAGLTDFKNKINSGQYGEAIGLKKAFNLTKGEILPIVAHRYIREKIGTEDLMALGLSHNELYSYLKLPTKVPEEIYKYNERRVNFLTTASDFTYKDALLARSLILEEDIEGLEELLKEKGVQLWQVADIYPIVNDAIGTMILSFENEVYDPDFDPENERLDDMERKVAMLKKMMEELQ